jgi:NADP-dependent 3-hydroxy acid dehydrogenase YdfG
MDTDFSDHISDPQLRAANERLLAEVGLDVADVATQIVHMLGLPSGVRLADVTISSTAQRQ